MPDHDPRTVVTIRYHNYRGEVGTRRIIPRTLSFCGTEWHPMPQWILDAWDVDKPGGMVIRSFALADVMEWKAGSHVADLCALERLQKDRNELLVVARDALEALDKITSYSLWTPELIALCGRLRAAVAKGELSQARDKSA